MNGVRDVPSGSPVFIGLDLGTSGLKGIAIDSSGEILASARSDYPTHRPVAAASEQDPHDWTNAIANVVGELTASVPAARWSGIGLSAMIPTMVVTDSVGRPMHTAVTWEDARAEDHGQRLRSFVGEQSIYEQTGQWVDGRYLLPMYARIADEVSEVPSHLLGAKDWILHWLTSEFATDPATATGTGAYHLADNAYSETIIDAAAELAGHALPDLAQVVTSTTLCHLTDDRARKLGLPAGLPIAVGAADAVAAILGLGVGAAGDVIYLAGTSTVIVGIDHEPHFDSQHRFLVTPLATHGYGHEMDLLATGSAMAWLANLLGLDSPDELAALARTVPAGQDSLPTMLGYVAPGEQGALWDPSLTGIIEGMNLHTSAADVARALLTSITVESARCIAVWDDNTTARGAIHVAGRGINEAALQELADATGRRTHLCGHAETPHSALGAALIVARALGLEPVSSHHVADLEMTPRPENAALWQQLHHRHEGVRTRTSASTGQ